MEGLTRSKLCSNGLAERVLFTSFTLESVAFRSVVTHTLSLALCFEDLASGFGVDSSDDSLLIYYFYFQPARFLVSLPSCSYT